MCWILVVIGGLNWGLVGIGMLLGKAGGYNLVSMLLGSWPMVEGVVYLIVGLATVMKLVGCKCAKCKACDTGTTATGSATTGTQH